MDSDRMRGDWAAIRLMVRQQWNRLTDEDLEAIDGDREALLNVLEQRYDSPRERLEQQVADFEGRIGGNDDEDDNQRAGRTTGAVPGSDRFGTTSATGSQMGSQGRQLYEEDSMPRNPQNDNRQQSQQQGRGANTPSQGDKRQAEEQHGAGSMANKSGEQQSGAGSMGNKRTEQDLSSGRQGNQQGSQQSGQQDNQQAGRQGSQQGSQQQGSQQGGPKPGQQSQQGSQIDRTKEQATKSTDEEDEAELEGAEEGGREAGSQSSREQADGSSSDKRSADQGDGYGKTDRQQQGGQKGKQPVIPPSWQRQSERRPEQPNR